MTRRMRRGRLYLVHHKAVVRDGGIDSHSVRTRIVGPSASFFFLPTPLNGTTGAGYKTLIQSIKAKEIPK